MKKIIYSLFAVAVAALAITSCQKAEPVNAEKSVTFTLSSLDTKTVFGDISGTTYPTLWTSDKAVKFSMNYATAKDADVTASADQKTAEFSADFTNDNSGSYTFYSLSPSNAFVSLSKDYTSWGFTVPSSQTPTAKSVDQNAQILAGKSSTLSSFPSKVELKYQHITAYGKLSFTNLELAGATIQSVELTAAENWAGRWYYYIEDCSSKSKSAGEVEANSASKTITITTSASTGIWFACAPVDLGGKTIDVTVNTSKGAIKKTVTIPTGKKFESGKVAKITVDMTGKTFETTKTYALVKSISDLTVNSEVLIAAKAYNYAISTTQNSNNRAQAAITKTGDNVENPGSDVQIFQMVVGNKANTAAFKTSTGYIYAASSSSNHLKTETSLSDNSSFDISIASDGTATIKAQGTNTRNLLRYNDSATLFSCYGSGQKDVCIYKLVGSGTTTPLF